MTIGVFKLITGEEIVSGFEDFENQPSLTKLVKPRKLMVIPTGPDSIAVKMIPWIIAEPDGDFMISLASIVAMTEANPSMVARYTKETTSIETATTADLARIQR